MIKATDKCQLWVTYALLLII